MRDAIRSAPALVGELEYFWEPVGRRIELAELAESEFSETGLGGR